MKQKKKISNKLFLHNPTKMDVSIDDLCLTIKSGMTIEVYKFNPLLTVEQVEKSVASGSIFRRLENKTLRIVSKIVSPKPMTLYHIKQSDKPALLRQMKSSIILTPESVMDSEIKEQFDFADYGIDRNIPPPIENKPAATKNSNGVITVGEAKPPARSLVAIKHGEDPVDNVDSADKIIKSGAKVLGENGEEVDTEPVNTENAIVIQTATENKK